MGFDPDNELYASIDGTKYPITFGYTRDDISNISSSLNTIASGDAILKTKNGKASVQYYNNSILLHNNIDSSSDYYAYLSLDNTGTARIISNNATTGYFNEEVATLTDLNNSYVLSSGTAISSGDLNNYTEVGNYYCALNVEAESLLNCPVTRAFTMKVEYSTGNGYPCQTIRSFHDGHLYYRMYEGSWNEWKKITADKFNTGDWWIDTDTSYNANDLINSTAFAYSASHGTPATGTLVSFSCHSNTNYPLQLQGSYNDNDLYFRNRNGDTATWGAWKKVMTTQNYTLSGTTLYINT